MWGWVCAALLQLILDPLGKSFHRSKVETVSYQLVYMSVYILDFKDIPPIYVFAVHHTVCVYTKHFFSFCLSIMAWRIQEICVVMKFAIFWKNMKAKFIVIWKVKLNLIPVIVVPVMFDDIALGEVIASEIDIEGESGYSEGFLWEDMGNYVGQRENLVIMFPYHKVVQKL